MQVINKAELKLEKYEKCSFICDSDCPIGMIYDFACAVQGFAYERMKQVEEQKAEEAKKDQEKAA